MRLSVGELKRLINEEGGDYARGIPEFVVNEAVRKFVDEIRQHIKRHVQVTKGSDKAAREAYEAATEALKELEEETSKLVEAKIWKFIRAT